MGAGHVKSLLVGLLAGGAIATGAIAPWEQAETVTTFDEQPVERKVWELSSPAADVTRATFDVDDRSGPNAKGDGVGPDTPLLHTPVRATTSTPAVVGATEPATWEAAPARAASAAPEQPSSSLLAAELTLYDNARQHLDRGDANTAVAAFLAYLRAFPSGHLRIEARLSLLEAYVVAQDWDATFAEELMGDPQLASKRPEIRRAWLDALLSTGQCDAAGPLIDELPASEASSLRRQCRKNR